MDSIEIFHLPLPSEGTGGSSSELPIILNPVDNIETISSINLRPKNSFRVFEDEPPLSKPDENVSLERAIELTNFGIFHVKILLLGCLTFTTGGCVILLNAIILPSFQCEMNITNQQKGLINAFFLIGTTVSGLVAPVIVNIFGKRKVMILFMSLEAFCTFISSLSVSYTFYLVWRTLCGFCIGAPSAVLLNYVGEFFPSSNRSRYLCLVGLMWNVSWVALPLVAMAVLPIEYCLNLGFICYNSWRLLAGIVSYFGSISVLLLYCLPETPIFHALNGEEDKALNVLNQMYNENHRDGSKYPVCALKRIVPEKKEEKSWEKAFVKTFKQFGQIFSPSIRTNMLLMMFIFYMNMFSYYGLGLWLPEIGDGFRSYETKFPNSTPTIKEVFLINESLLEITNCSKVYVTFQSYSDTLIIGSVLVLGNAIVSSFYKKVPRSVFPALFMSIASGCVWLLLSVKSFIEYLIVSVIFTFAVGTTTVVTNSLIVDLFPDDVSALACSLIIAVGRLGSVSANIIFGLFLIDHEVLVLGTCAVLLVLGVGASMKIPSPSSESEETTRPSHINEETFVTRF